MKFKCVFYKFYTSCDGCEEGIYIYTLEVSHLKWIGRASTRRAALPRTLPFPRRVGATRSAKSQRPWQATHVLSSIAALRFIGRAPQAGAATSGGTLLTACWREQARCDPRNPRPWEGVLRMVHEPKQSFICN